MTEDNPSSPTSKPVADAAGWIVRLHSDQVLRDEDAKFEAWERANEANAKEFEVHEDFWHSIGNLANDTDAVSFLMAPYPEKPRIWARPVFWGSIGVSAIAATLAAVMLLQPTERSQTYQTARGEQRDVVLDDGSSISLNTNSELRVSFAKKERRIFLESGEFHVQVAKDKTRPFRVFVDNREVRAVGTAFTVYRDNKENKTQVVLDEGVVAVYDTEARHAFAGFNNVPVSREKPAIVMEPGQQATLIPNKAPTIKAIDSEKFNAWRSGIVAFDDVPLGDAIKEVNRYSNRQIVLGDAEIADLKINGIFHINELDKFADKLTTLYKIRIEHKDRVTTVLVAG